MTRTPTRTDAIPEAIARAARWRLLGLLLERPRDASRAEIAALAREVDDGPLVLAATRALAAAEGQYLALFGPGGAVSPREAGHCGLEDPGHLVSELAFAYDAFGYAPRSEDPPDHVAVEVGFVAYLHLKEALALSCDDREAVDVTRAARDDFVARHLARTAAALATALAGSTSYLADVVCALAARVPAAAPSQPGGDDPLAGGCGACLGA